jgi:hypothetical protein
VIISIFLGEYFMETATNENMVNVVEEGSDEAPEKTQQDRVITKLLVFNIGVGSMPTRKIKDYVKNIMQLQRSSLNGHYPSNVASLYFPKLGTSNSSVKLLDLDPNDPNMLNMADIEAKLKEDTDQLVRKMTLWEKIKFVFTNQTISV